MNKRSTRDGITPQGRASWRVTVSGGRDPVTGKYIQIRETVRGTKTDAKRRRDEIRADVARGTVVRRGSETVSDYLERYLEHREKIGRIRPKTALVYRGYVRR